MSALTVKTFTSNGTFTFPDFVKGPVTLYLYGENGSPSVYDSSLYGGGGAYITGTLINLFEKTLNIFIDGTAIGGFNGGGRGGNRATIKNLSGNYIAVAGGGGGGGGGRTTNIGGIGYGGAAGLTAGLSGYTVQYGGSGGSGGSASGGGTGNGTPGSPDALYPGTGGGGGGGGYAGGKGGTGNSSFNGNGYNAGGGGGGSSYYNSTYLINTSSSQSGTNGSTRRQGGSRSTYAPGNTNNNSTSALTSGTALVVITYNVYYEATTLPTGTATIKLYRPLTLIATLQTPAKYYQLPVLNSGTLFFFKDYASGTTANNLNLIGSLEGLRNWSGVTFSAANTCLAIVPFSPTNYVLSASPLIRDGILVGSYPNNQIGPIIRSQFVLLNSANYQLSSTNYKPGSIIIIKNIYNAAAVSIWTDKAFIESGLRGCQIASGKNYCYIIGVGQANFFFMAVSDFTLGTPTTTTTPFTGSDCINVLQLTTSTGTSTATLIKGINIITSQTTATQKYYTLPALKSEDYGSMIIIKDGGGNAATGSPITIIPPTGYAIESTTNSLNLISPWSAVWLMFNFTPGIITTVAGNGTRGFSGDGGLATLANITRAGYITFDTSGNLFFADNGSSRIRMVANNTFTCWKNSSGVGVNFTKGYIYTIAGNGNRNNDGDGTLATTVGLNDAYSNAIDRSNNIYISDKRNNRIRIVTGDGKINAYSGDNTGTPGYAGHSIANSTTSSVRFNFLFEIKFDNAGNLFIADTDNNVVRMISNNTFTAYGQNFIPGYIYTIAGNIPTDGSAAAPAGYTGDGGHALNATLRGPNGIAFDNEGNLFIADSSNYVIRKVDRSSGIITTVAGNGTYGYSGDGGPALSASFSFIYGLNFDIVGNMYIADYFNYRIRMVNKNTGIITTIIGNGTQGYSGDNGLSINAIIAATYGITFDSQGYMYINNGSRWDITTQGLEAIRKITLFNNYSIVNYCTTN